MLNRCIVMGRMTRDPELRKTVGGKSVTSFTLAVDRDFKNQNGEKETDFIDVVAWSNIADFVCAYFGKGRMTVVEGRLQIREWTDKDGNKRRNAEIIAEHVYFGDSKDIGTYSAPATGYGTSPAQFTELPDEEPGRLPF